MTPIVSHPLQLVYYPIPKNATHGIRCALAAAEGLDWVHPWDGHVPLTKLTDPAAAPPTYRHITVVRHPAARLYSCWKDKVVAVAGMEESTMVTSNHEYRPFVDRYGPGFRGMDFPSFATWVCEIPDSYADAHFAGQLYQLKLMKMPAYADIFFQEKLDELPFTIPYLNRLGSDVPDIQPRLKSLLRKRYAPDFEAFEYVL